MGSNEPTEPGRVEPGGAHLADETGQVRDLDQRAERIFRDARPYGDPIDGAMATGDLAEMRRTAAFAEEWLAGATAECERVDAALAKLRSTIAKAESGGATAG